MDVDLDVTAHSQNAQQVVGHPNPAARGRLGRLAAARTRRRRDHWEHLRVIN